ncbi:MAG TPA: condensation domain-containing protein [Vicinamibacterales bacterium]
MSADLELERRRSLLTPAKQALLAQRLRRGLAEMAAAQAADGGALPQAVPDRASAHIPFPLTDRQRACQRVLAQQPEHEASAYFLEMETRADVERLRAAWNRIVQRHHMLRAVVSSTDQWVPLGDTQDAAFGIETQALDDGRVRMQISLDPLRLDGPSVHLLLMEWGRLYADPDCRLPDLDLSFRDYAMAWEQFRRTSVYESAARYWELQGPALPPPPRLPLAGGDGSPRVVRRVVRVEAEPWAQLRRRAAAAGLTSSGLLLAIFAKVLSESSDGSAFTVGVTAFNRLSVHPQVNDIAGPFSCVVPVALEHDRRASVFDNAAAQRRALWEPAERWPAAPAGPGGALLPVVFTSALAHFTDGQVAVAHENASGTSPVAWLGEPVRQFVATPGVRLELTTLEEEDRLFVAWDAREDLFLPGRLDDLFAEFRAVLTHQAGN